MQPILLPRPASQGHPRGRRARGRLAALALCAALGASALSLAPIDGAAPAFAGDDDSQLEVEVPALRKKPDDKTPEVKPPVDKTPPNVDPVPSPPQGPAVQGPAPNVPPGRIAVNDPAPPGEGDAVCTPSEPVMPTAPTKNAEKATVSRDVAVPGQSVTVTATGYGAGEKVQVVLFSEPTLLGTVDAGASGDASVTFTVGDDVAAGSHTVQLTGWCKRVAAVQLLVGQTSELGTAWAMPTWAWWTLGLLALLAFGFLLWRVLGRVFAARSALDVKTA